ncbi:poly-beta-1,6-N-acetyl-D-glucosamine synthase [Gammaproteobacteria bacterium]
MVMRLATPESSFKLSMPISPIIFVALGFFMLPMLGVTQLYYFNKLQVATAELSGFAFGFAVTFGISFLLFNVFAMTRYVLMIVSAYFGWTHTVRPQPTATETPLVSILLPAFNEEARIAKTIEAILVVNYPALEIIVVDDGSTDDTFAIAIRYVGEHQGMRVRVLRKPNGGKSTALNLGFRESHGPLVLCVDADSLLERNAVKRLVAVLGDPSVGAVSGQVRVRNRGTLLGRMQALEYAMMNGMPRLSQSCFSHVLIAPGPVAMFRRAILDDIWRTWGAGHEEDASSSRYVTGPWERDTFAEDCDLTLNTLLFGKRVLFEPAALSYTTAPDGLFPLLNQRYRWIRGNLQAVLKSWRRWHSVSNPPQALPLWLASFIIESILWPMVNVYGLLMFAGLLIVVGDVGMLLPWYLVLLLIEMNASAFAVRTMGERRVLILLSPIFCSVYSLLLNVNTLLSTIDELLLRKRMAWG